MDLSTLVTSNRDLGWPVMPGGRGSRILALLFQMEHSQWLQPSVLAAYQFRQAKRILQHAIRTFTFYREHLAAADIATNESLQQAWTKLPLLCREHLQSGRLLSEEIDTEHGLVSTAMTSGSTGKPVIVRRTGVAGLFWQAFTVRDHLWHNRDFRQTLAVIRFARSKDARLPLGLRSDNWGSATSGLFQTGPAYLLGVQATVAEQVEWLCRTNPGYLLTYPSIAVALAEQCLATGQRFPSLREVRTFGEIVEPTCREMCRKAWGVPLVDSYSSQEVGYIALQCPAHEHYHVQSENVLLEVIDDNGNPCAPGEVGKVVITTLQNFATPLIRYDIGDFAEVGEQCACGRGLPVLRRILGRQRNMLRLPNGERRWPAFGQGSQPDQLPPISQFQAIQRSRTEIELKLVRSQPLSNEEAERLRAYVQESLGYPFDITFSLVDSIPRSSSGKFEDFVSLVASPVT